ncbi:MAG: GAF domain-containing sensor histidine kinase [Anaerolineae bacterium]|nr:GAF domain-containing sensor histidine kinase [Anaerolineae bacterium]
MVIHQWQPNDLQAPPEGSTKPPEVAALLQRTLRLEQLLALSRQLNATREMGALLSHIVEGARDLLGLEAASILLVIDADSLSFSAFCGPTAAKLSGVAVPIEKSLSGWVVRNRKKVVLADTGNDPRLFSVSDIERPRSIVAVPMFFGEEIIGVLEGMTLTTSTDFCPEDIEILEILAGIAAVAVQNARLFQQSDWVAHIVHEIRTPLTSIMAYADMLNHPQIKPGMTQEFSRIIQQQAQEVSALVNQFLDLAQLESGRVTLERQTLNLPALIAHAIEVVHPHALAQAIAIQVKTPPTLPVVLGDPQRIAQVVLNLLTNAVKYGGKGATITIQVVVDDQLRVAVANDGPGIPLEQQGLLFQKFSRLPGSQQKAGGSGLGLSIARRIVEAHNGRIWVESAPGEGCAFWFTLPIAAAPEDEEAFKR